MRAAFLLLVPALAVAAPERLDLRDGRMAVVDGSVARIYEGSGSSWSPAPGADLRVLKNGPDARAAFLGRLRTRKAAGEIRLDLVVGDRTVGPLVVRADRTSGKVFADDAKAIRALAPSAGSLLARASAVHDLPPKLYRVPDGWIELRPGELPAPIPPTPVARPTVTAKEEIPVLPIAAGAGGLVLGLGLGALLFRRRREPEAVRAVDPALDAFRVELRRVAPRDLVTDRTYDWALGEIAAATRLRGELGAIPPEEKRTLHALAEAETAARAATEREALARREAERAIADARAKTDEAATAKAREEAALKSVARARQQAEGLADALAGVARAFGVEATSSEPPAAIVERLREQAVADRADDEAGDRRRGLARELVDRTEDFLDEIVRPADPEATAPFEAALRFAVGETALALAEGDEAALAPALLNLRALAEGAARREAKAGPERYAEFVRSLGEPGEPPLASGVHRHAVTWGGRVLAVRTGRFPISGFSRLYVRGPGGTYRISPPA